MQALLARLREPSSWAGLAVIAGVFGVKIAPEQLNAIVSLGAAAAGAAAVFLPEKK